MLTVTIFATIVADMLPVSNNTPLIGQHLDIGCTPSHPNPYPLPMFVQKYNACNQNV